jgi:hypothetical protein
MEVGDRDRARLAFEEVVAAHPDSIDALRGLAALALECEDNRSALDFHSRLIALGEHGPELFYNTGLLLQKSG